MIHRDLPAAFDHSQPGTAALDSGQMKDKRYDRFCYWSNNALAEFENCHMALSSLPRKVDP